MLRRALATTPSRLRLLATAMAVLAAVFAAVVISTAFEHDRAVYQIGVDDAPSVVAAHNIKIEIESLDADLLDEMLVPSGQHGEWTADFEHNRVDIGRHLIAAIHSAYGDDEDPSLEKLEDGLGHYLMVAQEARDAHHRGEPAKAIAAYEQSYHILETELVGPANELNKISDDSLEASYEAQQHHSQHVRIAITVLAIALVAMLVLIQLYVRKKFRRVVSIPLLAAIVVSIGFATCTLGALRAHARDLEGLKEHTYDSVDSLLATLADAHEANSSESRWLYDVAGGAGHERKFNEYVTRIAGFHRGGMSLAKTAELVEKRAERTHARVKTGESALTAAADAEAALPLDGMDGSLKIALDNVTIVDADPKKDEPTLAAQAVRAFDAYVGLDPKLRELEVSGSHAEAVRFCLGMQPGDSNFAFQQFVQAVEAWVAIKQERMYAFRDAAYADVAWLPFGAPITLLVVVGLVLAGLRPRLKEYA
jgi:hypothetical protein